MKKNKITSLTIFIGIIIVFVFSLVAAVNIVREKNESNSYYVKLGDEVDAKIEAIIIEDGKLKVDTSGNALEYCVKSTKTNPSINNICWKKIVDNAAEIAIYKYKRYYIWIKDVNGNISLPISVNTNKKS
ncbi:MAG: hypothetical protein GX951_04725 [Mollicutes bacterium]|nr:hypothetical protein [Mollicutes bacterium]